MEYQKSDTAEQIIEYLKGCRCEVIPPVIDAQPLWEKYLAAYERGKIEGFVPIYIVCDDNICDAIDENVHDFAESDSEELDEYRKQLLSEELPDANKLLKERFEEYMESFNEEFPLKDLYGEFGNGEEINIFTTWKNYPFTKTHELVYAEIPVKAPWEVFAWLPFGGWNDCPEPEDMMATAKLWYEKYGAVPGLISGDTLEFYLPRPVSDRDEALKLAEQQHGFCCDTVWQGCGTIKCLADSITKSTVWGFWWD